MPQPLLVLNTPEDPLQVVLEIQSTHRECIQLLTDSL